MGGRKGEGATSDGRITSLEQAGENTPSAVFKTSACGGGKGDVLSKENTMEAGVEAHTWSVLVAGWTGRGWLLPSHQSPMSHNSQGRLGRRAGVTVPCNC